MTGEEALAYIWSHGWETRAPGLDRIRELLRRLGDPQRELKFVHVAGTNGKGSVCACLASVLEAAGYRVGLNTSPHLERFSERIRVNGEEISGEALGAVMDRVRLAAEAMPEHPTEFELITAAALLHFLEERCEIVVLETGLGGALDASNVISTPEAAVLTAMGLDHAAILGPTLRDIAAAKAGIIKPGGAVVSRGGCPEADEVFRRTCRERGAALRELPRVTVRRLGPEGPQGLRPGQGVLLLPGGEDGPAAQGGGLLQGLRRVPGHVEGPVEGNRHAPGGAYQPGHDRPVQRARPRQGPQHHAVRPQVPEAADAVLHLLHLRRRVEEVPEAGADEDVDGEAAVPPDLLEQAQGGGSAADGEVGAQLQTVRAPPAGGQGGGMGVHAALDESISHDKAPFW